MVLAQNCVSIISNAYTPKCIIEPTCGLGTFLEAAYNLWNSKATLYGFEINTNYIDKFKKRCPEIYKNSKIIQADLFKLNINKICNACENPLVLGNPPWVTNSQLGLLNSDNLPKKSNIKGLKGFEALSGKSNFDISEWMIIKFSEALSTKGGVLSMLCKTHVARNVFLHNYNSGLKNVSYKIFKIDSKKEFGVSVEACFFIIDFYNGGDESRCDIFNELSFNSYNDAIGIYNNKIISNINKYLDTKDIVAGCSSVTWRSGIKHDASKIMELKIVGNNYINGLGEKVDIEDEYLYPLLKSSDLANNRLIPYKYVIITQKKMGEDTSNINKKAPKLWQYLTKYSKDLDNRKSSIYNKQPRFSIFGIGDYSFKPYKIAVSGLYKKINFCLLSFYENKPTMVDDTSYSLSFDNLQDAKRFMNILKSDIVMDYISSLIFLDAKRPINSDILRSIDFSKVEKYCNNFNVMRK